VKKDDRDGLLNNVSKKQIVAALKLMESNPGYQTEPSNRGSSPRWTNNYISFVEYHLNYLRMYPKLDPEQYIANLRLMLSKRPTRAFKHDT